MKKLKSFFLKLKAKKTLRTYQRPLAVTLVTLLLINIAVLCIGSVLALVLDGVYYNYEFFDKSFLSAFITNARWMISPNSLTLLNVGDNRMMMVLAIIIVILGMILFSGAIIATVTTALRTFIDKKSKAKGKIIVNNHFVILNWNSKVPEMIYNLMLKGFKKNIVILSDRNKEYIEAELKSLFLTNEVHTKIKANLIIKEGDSLLRGNLEDISIEEASQICIMAREDMVDFDDDNIINSDLLNLKIVLKLGSFKLKNDCQIVVETQSDETRAQIEGLSKKITTLKKLNITPISFNKKIGQIIAQSLVMPHMSNLYSELFSFEGSEFYSIESNDEIESYLKSHNQSIPVYKEDKYLFVLAAGEEKLNDKRQQEYTSPRKLEVNMVKGSAQISIFIIGENSKTQFLLNSLERMQKSSDVEFKFKHYGKTETKELIEDVKATEGLKKILILSDDKVASDSYDANVFVALIELSKVFPVTSEDISYTTELLDSRNLASVKDFNIQNTIISNKMMSLLITQLALNKKSKRFFEKILTISTSHRASDFDLIIHRVKRTVVIDEELKFESKAELLRTFYNTFEGTRILIGLIQDDQINLLDENQDEKKEIIVHPEDSFIYFKYMSENQE
jgi:hypothetical protein